LSLPAERRSSLLLLGVLVNETTWPYKLVAALQSLPHAPNEPSGDPEQQANFALTILLTTTLVGKIYEGWDSLGKGRLGATVAGLSLPHEIRDVKRQLDSDLSGQLFMRIRQNLAFHYHEKMIDFVYLKAHLKDYDTHFYVTAAGYHGDMLSHVSTLAMIDPLIGLSTLTSANQNEPIDPKAKPYAAYERVLEEVIRVAGLYLRFVSTALGVLINETFSQNLSLTTVSIPDAPEVGEQRSHFFVRPPCNLEEIKAGKAEP